MAFDELAWFLACSSINISCYIQLRFLLNTFTMMGFNRECQILSEVSRGIFLNFWSLFLELPGLSFCFALLKLTITHFLTRCSKGQKAANNGSGHSVPLKSPTMIRAEEVLSSLGNEYPRFVKLLVRSHVASCFWMVRVVWSNLILLLNN